MKRVMLACLLLAILLVGCSTGNTGPNTATPPKFFDSGYSAWFQGNADYKFDVTHWGEYSVYALFGIRQYITAATESKAAEVRVQNIRIVQQPKIGKVSFVTTYSGTSVPQEVGKDFVVWSGGDSLHTIQLMFKTSYLGVHQLGQNFSGTHGADWAFGVFSARAGLKSEDLRFKLAYQIQVKDISGVKYVRDVEVVMLSDDFLVQKNQFQWHEVKVDYKEPFRR